jgi:hypothetical protein
MTNSLTRGTLIGATVLGGLLAGMAANKVLVQLPAWGEAGVAGWATFTRTSDQGLGLALFPAIGAGALLLSIAAAVVFHFDRSAPRAGRVPIYLAPLLAIVALAVTILLLAPARLGLAQAAANISELQQLFVRVVRWWDVKALLHVLTFGANVWALVAVVPASMERREQQLDGCPVPSRQMR